MTVIHPRETDYGAEFINALTRDQQRTLWHMRLGHINHRTVSKAHEFADGIPDLPDKDNLHSCPHCLRSKLHKADKVSESKLDLEQVECWDHIQIDFGFMVQRSTRKDDKKTKTKKKSPVKEEDLDNEMMSFPLEVNLT